MADTQYVIDVAAQMPAGPTTLAQLDAMSVKLLGGGKAASYFADAIEDVNGQLTAAKATHGAASEALAPVVKQYRALEGAVADAQKRLDQAASKGANTRQLLGYEVAVNQAKASLEAYLPTLRAAEAAEAKASASVDKHARTLANVKTLQGHVRQGYEQNAQKAEKLAAALNQVGGPLGRVASGLVMKKKALGELAAVSGQGSARALALAGSAAMLGAAVVVVTAAFVAGTFALAAWAVGLANANREAELSAEAYDAMHPKLAKVRGEIDAIWLATGTSTDALQGWSEKLNRAGVRGANMSRGLRALATAELALGKGGAEKFAARMQAGGDAVSRVSKEIETKLGPIAAKRLLGLDAIGGKLKRNLGEVFGDLDIEPLLRALDRLVGMFGATSTSGKALKFLFESVFQPLIDKADAAAYVVEAVFLGLQIAALKVYLGLRPVLRALGDLFGFDTQGKGFATTLDLIVGGVELLARAAFILGIAAAAVAAPIAGMIALVLGIPAAMTLAVVAMGDFGVKAVKWLVGGAMNVARWFRDYDWAALGTSIVDGIVNGIAGGAARVWDAMKAIGKAAIGGGEEELEIASPSKAGARMGRQTVEGVAQGVEDGEDDVRAAVAEAVRLPAPGTSGASAPSTSSTVAARAALPPMVNNFYGVKDAEHAADMFEEVVTRLLEGDALTLGGAAP